MGHTSLLSLKATYRGSTIYYLRGLTSCGSTIYYLQELTPCGSTIYYLHGLTFVALLSS